MSNQKACLSCGSSRLLAFYEVEGVPSNSCLLMESVEEAIEHPKGNIALAFCEDCGFVFNAAFAPILTKYTSRYEETQAYSPTFNHFHRALADGLIERHDLRHKHVIEIGCGKGEFLTLLCERGENSGVGFDPGYRPERNLSEAAERITFIRDFYSECYAEHRGDFVCCKMTLEHIPNVSEFVKMLHRSIGDAPSTVVFFQVPEASAIWSELRFWDIYYEHCSYFSPLSLQHLFANAGFHVLDVATDFDDQYLMIEARPAAPEDPAPFIESEKLEDLSRQVSCFQSGCQGQIRYWQERLRSCAQEGKSVVLWGSGSKGVSFLTTLGIDREIGYVVDINPYRQEKFMPGSGHKIVGPDFLKTYSPDLVIVMNPIYRNEIGEMLNGMELSPQLETV